MSTAFIIVIGLNLHSRYVRSRCKQLTQRLQQFTVKLMQHLYISLGLLKQRTSIVSVKHNNNQYSIAHWTPSTGADPEGI